MGAQRGDREQGEMPARPGQALSRGTRFGERSRIGGENALENLVGRAEMSGRGSS
jgi:hypothetical protein